MSESVSRYIQIGDWCFEIKMVRALKVDRYGEPYSAIANCNINGSSMYIDGLLTKEGQQFTKDDFMTFFKFTEALGLDEFSYHRFHQGKSSNKTVTVRKNNVMENHNNTSLKLA